jgi:hypothetical protein
MKKITHILLLLFFLNSFSSKAQYIPLVKDSAHWLIAVNPGAFGMFTYSSIFEYYSLGDTIVNSNTYKKVYKRGIQPISGYFAPYQSTSSYTLFALLREDTVNRKVYTIILPPGSPSCSSNQEVLLYDFFNLSIGDTLNSCTSYSLHPCPAITSIFPSTYGSYNTIIYEYGCSTPSRYYEGIGGWDGLFEEQLNSVVTLMWGYCIGSDVNCDIITSVKKIANNNFLSIYPNPNNGVFNIEIKDIGKTTIEIYNISGQLILQKSLNQNISKISLSNYPKGMYFIKVKMNNETMIQKIVYK